jgi:hypothetical protein
MKGPAKVRKNLHPKTPIARTYDEGRRERGRTHEGGVADVMTNEEALRRSVMSCFLWENEFYEDGKPIADRIGQLCTVVPPKVIADLAIEARGPGNLRHVPLLLLTHLARVGSGSRLVGDTIPEVIQRADDMTEFLAIYAQVNKQSPSKLVLSAQVKRGLALAFGKFDEYQLAKYDRDGPVKLRDVIALAHVKSGAPKGARNKLHERVWQRTMKVPDTWETELSAGKDKLRTWTRMLGETLEGDIPKLGYLAVLRNLRNMLDVGVDENLVKSAILARRGGAHRVLPFRFTAAARACPRLEATLDQALCESIADMPVLPGKTLVFVDVSDSMNRKLSDKSDLSRMDAAATLASVINAEALRVFTFSNDLVEVPARRGMAGVDAIKRSQVHSGTYLWRTLEQCLHQNGGPYDRVIVITDEQAHDSPSARIRTLLPARCYLINTASNRRGVAYREPWVHIDGFSEAVLRWIMAHEGGAWATRSDRRERRRTVRSTRGIAASRPGSRDVATEVALDGKRRPRVMLKAVKETTFGKIPDGKPMRRHGDSRDAVPLAVRGAKATKKTPKLAKVRKTAAKRAKKRTARLRGV